MTTKPITPSQPQVIETVLMLELHRHFRLASPDLVVEYRRVADDLAHRHGFNDLLEHYREHVQGKEMKYGSA